jgi:hypothetical protein
MAAMINGCSAIQKRSVKLRGILRSLKIAARTRRRRDARLMRQLGWPLPMSGKRSRNSFPIALVLAPHPTDSYDQVGPLENFNQLIKNDALIVAGLRLQILFKNPLRIADGLKS